MQNKNTNTKISIVIPLFNEEGNLAELYKSLYNILVNKLKIDYEIIFIDDGSEDKSWQKIKDLHSKNINVKGIQFSRNFGHQYALKAGLDYSNGDSVISLDADLQHPTEMIIDFYNKWKDGYKIVQGIRKETKGIGIIKDINSRIFYRIINFLSDVEIYPGSSDFRLLDRKVVDEIKKMDETQFFLRGIVNWIGYENISIEYTAEPRFSGSSKYSFMKMIKFATDGIMSFSIKPLRLVMLFGMSISFISLLYALIVVYLKIFTDINVPGLSSILFSILFLGGIQFIVLGIIGEYIGKIFISVKRRSLYLINDKEGL